MKYCVALFLFFVSCTFYQKRSEIAFAKAELLYAKNEFLEAFKHYELAFKLDKSKTSYLKLAKCYEKLGDQEKNIFYLNKAYLNNEMSVLDKIKMANSLKVNGLIDSSRAVYQGLSNSNSVDKVYCNKQIQYLDSIISLQNNKSFQCELIPNLNSKYDDVQPFMAGDTLFFCSNRSVEATELPQFKIFEMQRDTLNSVRIFKPKESELNDILKGYTNISAITMVKGRKKIYFSSTIMKKNITDSLYRLKMFTVAKDSNFSWSKPHGFIMNNQAFSFGHPYVTPDESMFFFSSDMAGGYGGKDIWVCLNVNKIWSDPINLGPVINSPGNEIYPFYDSSGKLYFASDYHPGFGGWDIHYATEENGDWKSVENAGSSINSSADEINIFIHSAEKTTYFTSNRKNGVGGFDMYWIKK